MSAREDLDAYLSQLHRRARLGTLVRGGAAVAAAALVSTIAVVLLARLLLFSSGSITGARLVLLAALAVTIASGIALPLWRLTRQRAAALAEERFPQFQQRLLTYAERDRSDPFLELLAADTLEIGRNVEPRALTPRQGLLAWLAAGTASAGVLVWLIAAAPGFMGYGAHLVWTGAPRGPVPHYGIEVTPGDVTIRRHSDQLVTATPAGLRERDYLLYARYGASARWERVRMQPIEGSYQFVLTDVPEDVEYYVQAGMHRSRHFVIRTVDVASIKQLSVTYHFPDWTGLPDQTEQGGDLHALEGTQATLAVTTDRPLRGGQLVLDSGEHIALTGGAGNHYQGVIRLQQDGAYHVADLDHGQPVRLSEDYFIEARKASAPTVAIVRPGGDYRASPIEEVTVGVQASDDFGLTQLELHYSVNGGEERTLPLLPQSGVKQATAARVLALEDYQLVPGDVISLYASARNALLEAHTPISFIQVDPFEREFAQSQTMPGAGGGGGGEYGEVSEREKEIIAETFKQLNDRTATAKQAADSAQFLSEVQKALRDQSLSLAGRLSARELTAQNDEFSRFQQEMTAAADAMSPAAQLLQQQGWRGAIPQEQKALQHLLRAEATFREIEVAYGARGGGGAGAGRDLASLFDLELDTEKNQYETQQTASPSDQRARDINDALKKLDELARRQQELAQRARDQASQAPEQRWQQELLQRQAQELQRQMEQLAQAGQARGGGSSRADANGSSGEDATGGQTGSESGAGGASSQQSRSRSLEQAQRAAEQALEQLRQAQRDMQQAAAQGRAADARLAAERLREAIQALTGMQSQQADARLAAIAHDAQQLVAAEADQNARVRHLTQQHGDAARASQEIQQLVTDRQRLADALVSLQQNMRDAARELDFGQRAAADKLRSALKDMDDADLESLLQRTSDWLRTGIDPNSRNTESDVAAALQRLSEQAQQAEQALGSGGAQPGGSQADDALAGLARLRDQIGALDSRGTPGPQRAGGGNRDGLVVDNLDTGNNARGGAQAHARAEPQASPDTQRLIEQGVGELQALRRQTAGDPESERQIQQLISEMQHLDLRRFPGNPAMIEQIHAQLLSDVDSLELQLRHKLDTQQAAEIRAADPFPIPHGYEQAVADYFRRLSQAAVMPQ
jgi:hypothetical protein